ncbi:MAG: molecular chaperone TorD family protein [Campylobacterales bacterium]|nr:molecular chaperone TorD family protein [Campylobacterales bacterium]
MQHDALGFAAGILSEFLAHAPSPQAWEALKKEGLLREWFIHPLSQEGVALWEEAHKSESQETVAVDYTQLFLCDEEFLKAPPYGAYYLDPNGETYTQESDAVLAFYNAYGFSSPLQKSEPADHLAIELAFLSALFYSAKTQSAFEQGLKTFVADHLAPWVKGWTGHVKTHAKSAFYKGLAFMLEAYVKAVIKELNIDVKKRKLYRLVA